MDPLPNTSHTPQQSLQDLLAALRMGRVGSAEHAELAGTHRLEMYPIQNTDIDTHPYGYRAVVHISTLTVIHVLTLLPDWFTVMAVRRLQGLPIIRPHNTFIDHKEYQQIVFSSSCPYIDERMLEVDLLLRPRTEAIKFIEATKL